MRLALFDLDHTLIPFDSGLAWMRFLAERGVLPAAAVDAYLDACRAYVAGALEVAPMHRALLQPLREQPRTLVAQWQGEFETAMAPRLPAVARACVRRHLDAGHLCAIVTTTTRLVAEPFARLFGIAHLVSSQAATADGTADGAYTGEIDGEPCHREHKPAHVRRWLARLAPAWPAHLEGYARSICHSDSFGDLPLLSAVTDPVAVSPDARLRAHALAAGWPIVEWR
jgi:HAD superfamily hydrolase (TIGR01490 family)